MPARHPSPPDKVLRVSGSIGPTVVDLHHVDPSPPPARKPAPRTLAIVGALCLLASLIAFGRGVSVSAANEEALAEAIAANRAGEFRPQRLGIGHDLVAFGGLLGGILCFAGALAMARAPRPRTGLTLGEAEGADLAWEGVELAELVRAEGGALTIEVPADAEALLHIDDLEAEVTGAVELPDGDRLVVSRGPALLHFEWAARPRAGHLAAPAQIDQRTLAYAGAVAGAFALFLSLIWNLPPARGSLAADDLGADQRLAYYRVAPPDDDLLEKLDRERGPTSGDASTGEPTSAGLEGDMGEPDETRTDGKAKIERVADADPSVANRTTEAEAAKAGVLGIVSTHREYISNLSSTAEFTNGLDETTILGGMDGEDYNARRGLYDRGWGGRVSFSNSPYAADWGTTRVGKLPTGGRTGDEYSPISGDGGPLRDRQPRTPVVDIDVSASSCSVAGCDKQTIRRYIKKHHARFRYCYEKSLVRRPDLSGTVQTRFLISGTGRVQGASAGGIGDSELESCVARVLSSIRFPVVADGDMVSVKYPFHFHHVGR